MVEGDVCGEAILFVVLAPDLAEAALGIVLSGELPAKPAVVLGPFHDLFGIHAGVADNHGCRESRAFAGIHLKRQGDLLVLGIASDFGLDFREVKTVTLEQIADSVGSGFEVRVIVRCAEFEAGGILKLALAGRHFDFAVNLERADKPLLGRADDERDVVTLRNRFDLDVRIFAGRVETLDGIADFGEAERRARRESHETCKIGGRHRLSTRLIADLGDRPTFVLVGRREVGAVIEDRK